MSRPAYLASALALIGAALATPAVAAPVLLARASLAGDLNDLSGLPAPLENGVRGDLLGGFGSGIAYAGNGTFLATPDRGPNANPYNPLVDDTASYINRFQSFNLSLNANQPGASLPFSLTPTLTATTLLSSATPLVYGSGALGSDATHTLGSGAPALNASTGLNYFTGRSDNFDASRRSGFSDNARLDPESIRVANDGKSVFISDEYGPYVYQFDRASGQRVRSFALPSYFSVSNLSAQGDAEISGNTQGRLANKGMEGLAITPDGKTLVGIMQSPLIQDGGKGSTNVRIVTIDIASGATHEYVYKLANKKNTVSEIVAINDHEFLVDERDGNGGTAAAVKRLYKINLSGATDVSGQATLAGSGVTSVGKSLFLDLLDPAFGLAGFDFPAKIEGLAFGDDVVLNGETLHTLYVTNDNDFLTDQSNNFYVFGIAAADLAGFQAQQLTTIPEPASLALLLGGLGMLGYTRRRRG